MESTDVHENIPGENEGGAREQYAAYFLCYRNALKTMR